MFPLPNFSLRVGMADKLVTCHKIMPQQSASTGNRLINY